MQDCTKTLGFEFNNSADALVVSLQHMLDHIKPEIPASADVDDTIFRCKVIITELLTNAIKHGGEANTLFDIKTDGRHIVINKTDSGPPLYLINAHNTPEQMIERKLISADPLNSLYAVWETENHIRFSSEEGSIEDFLSIEAVMEHFGMLIITRSSNEFTYTYDKEKQSNVFRVSINL